MAKLDLTGIKNQNEYYTNHYFSTIFEENAEETISKWRTQASENESIRTPWSRLKEISKVFYQISNHSNSSYVAILNRTKELAERYLRALGYGTINPQQMVIDDHLTVPVFHEVTKSNGAPLLWVFLSAQEEGNILEGQIFRGDKPNKDSLLTEQNEDVITEVFFSSVEPPRFVILIGLDRIALIDRNKWNEKRFLEFDLQEIYGRREDTTFQAVSVLLHKESLCPEDGKVLLDEFDDNSQKSASGVSNDLKYALRESIELLGNEILYDLKTNKNRDLESDPVDAGQLTIECLRYMYRMLFVLFIESRPELGYAPIKSQSYHSSYSLESLRDIAEDIRDEINEVGNGYYLHETLSKLYKLIYDGYPATEEDLLRFSGSEVYHDMFVVAPLKAHIFDPEYTKLISNAKIRNSVMLRIIDLMSLTRTGGKKGQRRQRISYANLGINQMGSVYEALLSYRGFIAEETLYEVKRAGDKFDELDVGYFVPARDLEQYTEDERVRYEHGENKGKPRVYEKGVFIYRLAGREREKSASYYTPEVLTKCLVKYALKELLKDKTADEILELTVCEPAMGSAAFLNEAINQLAEAYLDKKQKERGELIPYDKRFNELQKVKMYIADKNVYGIDLNPIAVELAEVSLWLNTIYEGGFVPWFGTQLVNGNSLIGARRQVYDTAKLISTAKQTKWYEEEPERLGFQEERHLKGAGRKQARDRVYHFLLGDPGMCNYKDKVIKQLEKDNIELMNKWRKEFTKPYTQNDLDTLEKLSKLIDHLWKEQIRLRKQVEKDTSDVLSVYGHEDTSNNSHTSIRQKDKIYKELYKSENMLNAGPYARLKFAMDYWCSLWFWPIDKAELLPTRNEFFFDMSLILEGTVDSVNLETKRHKGEGYDFTQISLLETEIQKEATSIQEAYANIGINTKVNIAHLREVNERLDTAWNIANQNKFMHWELEFADLFAEKGGFDLIVGNPPWVLLGWNELFVLSDINPSFSVKKLTSGQISKYRDESLVIRSNRNLYFEEYVEITGQQNFLNGFQNYPDLIGMKANLYKCFLPQAWNYSDKKSVFGYVHPNSVFDDPKGKPIRKILYPKIRMHFQFINEKLLFKDVGHPTTFSLNIYSNQETESFDAIFNLFDPITIDRCYTNDVKEVPLGLKDNNNDWNLNGHPDRILKIDNQILKLFSDYFENGEDEITARIPSLQVKQFVDVLKLINNYGNQLINKSHDYFISYMWHETYAQDDRIIKRETSFVKDRFNLIYSGPHIGVGLPFNKTPRRKCLEKADYDTIDLTFISEDYLPRTNYQVQLSRDEYYRLIPKTPWGIAINDEYRFVARRMINLKQERSLISAIVPDNVGQIHGVFGLSFRNMDDLLMYSAGCESIVFDFLIKVLGKTNLMSDNAGTLPVLRKNKKLILRTLLLNCLTSAYGEIWKKYYSKSFLLNKWGKEDLRLRNEKFENLSEEWKENTPERTDFGRRQLLIEIDVLVAMEIGLSLNQLIKIYQIQFPVLNAYENDTWYDANGRIVFTNNRSLTNVGFTRQEWENGIKGAAAGTKFYRTIVDDTMPDGPVERTIEYMAPFDKCDREKDYEIAWKFFEEKYGK